jgi:hypothetical protein
LTYAGTLAEDVAAVASGGGHARGPLLWVGATLTALAAAGTGFGATIFVRRAVRRAAAVDAAAEEEERGRDRSPERLRSLDREGVWGDSGGGWVRGV